MADIAQKFDEVPWHDAKLLEIFVHRTEGEDRLRLRVLLHRPSEKLVDIEFNGSMVAGSMNANSRKERIERGWWGEFGEGSLVEGAWSRGSCG